MSQSLSNLLVHIIFSTKKRKQNIRPGIKTELYSYISGVCKKLESPVQQIGGISDHIHILVSLSRSITISKLVGEIKANSSRWIKTRGENYRNFSWQNGYGAFSIGQSGFQQCTRYIAKQEQHHKKVTFQEEYLRLLKRYQVDFDKKFLWD